MKTTGFKGSDTLFANYVFKLDQNDRTFKDKVAFVHDLGLVRNLSQGVFEFTGNTFDLSIRGEGYFVTRGRGGVETYTRAGNFAISSEGNLVTMEGRLVLGRNGAPINIPGDAKDIVVQGDGTIAEDGGRTFGQLRTVRFEDERELKQVDGTGFVSQTQQPIDLQRPAISQGVLEASNVNPVLEMTRLISLNRAYQDNAKMITQEDERKRRANEVFTKQISA